MKDAKRQFPINKLAWDRSYMGHDVKLDESEKEKKREREEA